MSFNTQSSLFAQGISRQQFLRYGLFGLGLSLVNSSCNTKETIPILRIGINDWIGYQIIHAARSLNYFKQRQVEVNFIYFNNLQDATRAMYRGSLDATFTTIWDLLELSPERKLVEPQILLVTDVSAGADGIVARSPLQKLSDLRGKNIGVKLATVNQLILLEALHLHQISPTEIEMINLPNEVAAQQLLLGKLDAIVLWQPLLGEIAEKIGGKIVHNTSQADSLVIDVLATTPTKLQQKAQSLQRFLWVWLDLMQHLEKKPESVFKALSSVLGRDPRALKQDYQGVKAGTRALNKHFFGQEFALGQAIAEITQLIQADPHHAKPVAPLNNIDPSFSIQSLNSWSALP
ncbi:MAG: ABC transporter substrate-binding protein [Microcystaceae cyanobacterium]